MRGYKCNPRIEVPFLLDQRTDRNITMSGIDNGESNRIQKLIAQNKCENTHHETNTEPNQATMSSAILNNIIGEESDENANSDSSPSDIIAPTNRQKTQMCVKVSALASACDRHDISGRSAAAITSAVLQDFCLIDEYNQDNVVDQSKVRRERSRKRKSFQADMNGNVEGLYFDGRKDRTLVNEKEHDDKYHRRIKTEVHISIISEPESKYFCHVTPDSDHSKEIANSIKRCLQERYVDTDDIPQ